ncbi:MAG: hypothetical protein NTV06_03845 [candidate division Zixibacteria bacterium]|nr:hypothetical protein [candidate division Zixibacteria bacterium]
MDCQQVKRSLSEKIGALGLNLSEKEHIHICADCRIYYERLMELDKYLKCGTTPIIKETEFATIQKKLDEKIGRYQNRALYFYHLSVRYGISLTAVILLLIVSLIGKSGKDIYQSKPADHYDTLLTLIDEETIDEQYIEAVVNGYVQTYGINSGEMLIGDLTPGELEYLKSEIKAGDIFL